LEQLSARIYRRRAAVGAIARVAHRAVRRQRPGAGLGEDLRWAVSEYVEHYHRERNHQGVGNRLLTPAARASQPANGNQPIECHERLGGLLNFYYRRAA
jgi:hypothetical protein